MAISTVTDSHGPRDVDLSALTHNPYWDAVRDLVTMETGWDAGPKIGGIGMGRAITQRFDRTSEYAWTVTAPETVAFVAEYIGASAIDPLAGSGYWAYLLRQLGVDVLASDIDPAGDGSANHWHRDQAWLPMLRMDAVGSVARASAERTLLLSWPPYGSAVGTDVLKVYRGNRVIYIGESEGGCCGDDAMFELLGSGWDEVAEHKPVQFFGMHDFVTVYDRKCGVS